MEQVGPRAVSRPDGRTWLRWGAAVFVGFETVHLVGGTLANDWEGWDTFLGNLAFVVVSGIVLVGLTYGLLVRWSLRPSPQARNRAAIAALVAGVLSVATYPLFFTWAPVLIAPAALVLGREGLARAREGQNGRAFALAGGALALASLAVFAALLGYAAMHDGEYPWIFGG
jgi:hypothetical protein